MTESGGSNPEGTLFITLCIRTAESPEFDL